MLKKALLSTLVLLSNVAVAQIQIDFDLAIENQENTRTVTCSAILEENTIGSFEDESLIIDVMVQENDDKVIVQANIYEKSEENGVVLVSSPALVANWNEKATVSIGEKSAEEVCNMLTFSVTPSHVE